VFRAEGVRFDARETVARLFGVRDPMRVIFSHNATSALNLVMQGLLTPGSHVVTSGIEHNAVMRPLRALQRRGVAVSVLPCSSSGETDPADLAPLIRPETRLIVTTHSSNVCGTLTPIREIGAAARERGVPFLVDAAQTAGCVPIDLETDNIDLLAFSGHKELLGPTGMGGLALRDDFDFAALPARTFGGTGSRSEHEEQPDFLPDKYESGTPNIAGLAGLFAGVRYIMERGVAAIQAHERALTRRLIAGLSEIPGSRIQGTRHAEKQTAVVSFFIEGASVSETSRQLDERFEIMARPGLHCAPAAHHALGTFPEGTIRFSPGLFTTDEEIDRAVDAVARIAGEVGA